MSDESNGWTHMGETWASGQVWECDNCGREKVTELIRNPDPTPEKHHCWGPDE